MISDRRLYLLRHAKAAGAAPGTGDYDRPLEERGRRDSRALGRMLMARGVVFDTVVCSGALRTRQTWEGLVEAGYANDPAFDDGLYEGGPQAYAAAFRAAEGAAVLLIGHNPMIGEEARRLAALDGRQASERLAGGMPKAALAGFTIAPGASADAERVILTDWLTPPFDE